MKCIKCGNKIKDINERCPKCGAYQYDPEKDLNFILNKDKEEKKDDEVPISTAIATVLVIVFITCAVIGFYFAYGKDKIAENSIRKQLNNISGDQVIQMYYDDFNGDGSSEVFAVTGKGTAAKVEDGTIWYVKDTTGLNVTEGFSGSINGIIASKGKKYISVEIIGKDGESTSFICGANKYSDFYQPEVSGKYSRVHQEGANILTGDGRIINVD